MRAMMIKQKEFKPNLAFYNGLVSRLKGREKPFKDKQHAYLFLMFGSQYKKYLPSLNGHRRLKAK